MKLKLAVFPAVVILLVGACSGATSTPSSGPSTAGAASPAAAAASPGASPASCTSYKGTIALAMSAVNQTGLALIQKDIQNAAETNCYHFTWTNGQADPAKELSDAKDLIAKKPSLLVLDPVQSGPLDPVAQAACKAGVPMMTVDREITTKPGTCTYLATFTWNWVTVGELMGKSVVNWAKAHHNGQATGNFVHITGIPAASPTIDVNTGLMNVFKQYPGIKIVATCDGEYQRANGRTCMEDLLQRFPKGSIDGTIVDNDDMGLGAIDAIKAAGRTELLGPVWSHDATKPFLQAMLNGDAWMTVRRPIGQGAFIIKAFQEYKAGQKVAPTQYVTVTPYDISVNKQAVIDRINNLTKLGLTDN